jgi:hypothetical protein
MDSATLTTGSDHEGKKKLSINRFPNFVAFVPFFEKLTRGTSLDEADRATSSFQHGALESRFDMDVSERIL